MMDWQSKKRWHGMFEIRGQLLQDHHQWHSIESNPSLPIRQLSCHEPSPASALSALRPSMPPLHRSPQPSLIVGVFTKLHFSGKAIGAAVSALGIHNKDGVIVYDRKGMFSVARVWWMFIVFRHVKVWVLDGGLPKWHSSRNDVESSASGEAILKASEWGG